ncbi:MAG: ABC transporter permease [Planctomycetaceae bacterium]
MRPYLAVLKDSFREAMASRVLWIALIGIVAILLGMAPFGLNSDKATQLRRRELAHAERFTRQLYEERSAIGTPAAHVWSLLNPEQRSRIEESQTPNPEVNADQPRRGGFNDIERQTVDAINELLAKPEFYDADSFRNVELDDEAENLCRLNSPSDREISRRNLLLLAAAFPRSIQLTDDNALSLSYAGQVLFEQLPIRPGELDQVVDEVLIAVVAMFLGFFGVFASLLVTAGIMPRTFEPGEISLLLSKPVSRSLLFLTKFFGGCMFTLLCDGTGRRNLAAAGFTTGYLETGTAVLHPDVCFSVRDLLLGVSRGGSHLEKRHRPSVTCGDVLAGTDGAGIGEGRSSGRRHQQPEDH